MPLLGSLKGVPGRSGEIQDTWCHPVMLPWCPRGTFSPGSLQPPRQEDSVLLWGALARALVLMGGSSIFCQDPLDGYWELGLARAFGSPIR